jgi:hypothetical protein
LAIVVRTSRLITFVLANSVVSKVISKDDTDEHANEDEEEFEDANEGVSLHSDADDDDEDESVSLYSEDSINKNNKK